MAQIFASFLHAATLSVAKKPARSFYNERLFDKTDEQLRRMGLNREQLVYSAVSGNQFS